MIETHPFDDFIPKNSKYLILGSFTGKRDEKNVDIYDWYYGSKRNQFWRLLESVYDERLSTKSQKQKFFARKGIAIADIIYSCKRSKNNNSDTNLTNIMPNPNLEKTLRESQIVKIFFTSRFVERLFKRYFSNLFLEIQIDTVTLPSPSPRYARLSFLQKASVFKKMLPE